MLKKVDVSEESRWNLKYQGERGKEGQQDRGKELELRGTEKKKTKRKGKIKW